MGKAADNERVCERSRGGKTTLAFVADILQAREYASIRPLLRLTFQPLRLRTEGRSWS